MNAKQYGHQNRPLAFLTFLLLGLLAGCDGILGIDSLDIGCLENDRRCLANAPQVCNADGQWEAQQSCGEQTCVATPSLFGCFDCAPETTRCKGKTPQSCDSLGQWQSQAPCGEAQQCKAGLCVVACTPGSKRCFENKKQSCDDSGQWQDDINALCVASTCDPDTVECVGNCAPGQFKCKDAKTLQSCEAKGVWKDDKTCDPACADGKCTDCTPGELGCAKDGTPQSCGNNGQWKLEAPCLNQSCAMGMCVGECAPGKRCLGNTPQTCNAMGQWEGSTPCDPGQVCSAGTCTCTEGDRRCFENRPQLCDALNQWVDDGVPCSGQTCDSDVAACVGVCEPSQTQCLDANTSQHCDPKGQWQTTASCALGCLAGECAACSVGEIRCTGNTPQTCSANGQWQDGAECVGQTCVAGSCQGQCTFGDIRCVGKWPQTCDPVGTWNPPWQPCALGESCFQGQCEALCTPDAKRCAGDSPQTCDANGQWQSDGPACGACVTCNPALGVCEPNPMPLDVCTEPLAIEAGDAHTCALFPNGKLKCWGNNDAGQLGLGDTNKRGDQAGEMGSSLPFVELGLALGVTVVQISAGDRHTCALTSDGRIKCWGQNTSGQLGLGDWDARGDEPFEMGIMLPFVKLGLDPGVTVAQISAGGSHTCALTSDGRIKCWGDNEDGQLGLGDTNNRGDQAGEMGASLPFVKLGLDSGVTVVQISAGNFHTCALTSDGRIKCWGDNEDSQLGLGKTKHRGDEPNEMGTYLPFVKLGLDSLDPKVTVAQISAGFAHTCALTSDERIKCWGYNFFGQLGLGDTNDHGDVVGEMGANLPFVHLGLNPGVTVAQISAGGCHTCARTSDGRVKCWGRNFGGQLGLGDTLSRGNNLFEMGAILPFVDLGLGATASSISEGDNHTCALLSGGSVKCWGYNFFGQLGLFDTLKRGDEPNEMGDSLPTLEF